MVACGLIPFLYVTYSTSPFVTTIHVHLPPFARSSQEMLARFARTVSPSTRIDVTTMSVIGKPRTSSMVVGDLKPTKKRLGMVNYERDTEALNRGRKWWRFRAVKYFNVQQLTAKDAKRVPNAWVWLEIAKAKARAAKGGMEKGEVVKKGAVAGKK